MNRTPFWKRVCYPDWTSPGACAWCGEPGPFPIGCCAQQECQRNHIHYPLHFRYATIKALWPDGPDPFGVAVVDVENRIKRLRANTGDPST